MILTATLLVRKAWHKCLCLEEVKYHMFITMGRNLWHENITCCYTKLDYMQVRVCITWLVATTTSLSSHVPLSLSSISGLPIVLTQIKFSNF